jgi:hypothetical protein
VEGHVAVILQPPLVVRRFRIEPGHSLVVVAFGGLVQARYKAFDLDGEASARVRNELRRLVVESGLLASQHQTDSRPVIVIRSGIDGTHGAVPGVAHHREDGHEASDRIVSGEDRTDPEPAPCHENGIAPVALAVEHRRRGKGPLDTIDG